MIHFRNYQEYQEFRRRLPNENSRENRENRTELVMEDNTIYEIDTDCEECLKRFWRWKASEQTEKDGRS